MTASSTGWVGAPWLARDPANKRFALGRPKRINGDRIVPIVHLGEAFLLQFAMLHADGGGILLRRPHAQWLRRSGVQPADLAPVMGHAGSRTVARVSTAT